MKTFFTLISFSLLLTTGGLFAQTVEFTDDFESGTAAWTLEGTWGVTDAQSNSPSNSLTDSPGGNYAADLNISATLATPIDLSAALDANLSFSAIYDIEDGNFDYCYVEASADNGATWINLATIFGQGNLTPWVEYEYSLGGLAGSSEALIRFRLFSDGGFEVDGIYIDDVEITSSDIDNAAPLILHTPAAFYEATAGDVTLEAEIVDISGIGSAELNYTADGVAQTAVAGVVGSGDIYTFTIPSWPSGTEINYSVTATDASTNTNAITSPTFAYIAGNHVFYDNGTVNFVNTFGPDAASGLSGCAVKFNLFKSDVAYALIRNYTDSNRPNNDFEFHVWANDNGLPGADLITPFMVTPEANLDQNSIMTRVDLRDYVAELSAIEGDIFMGYTVPVGQTWLVQTTPGIGGNTYTLGATGWAAEPGDDYHFRLVTTDPDISSDDCATATSLAPLMGGGVGNPQTSPIATNVGATSVGDPADGFECFGEPDGGGATPSLENTLWYTFEGDGLTYYMTTNDCGGTAADYIDDGDTQIALYSGTACDALTPVACNEDGPDAMNGGPYPAGLTFTTEVGVTYYMLIDGFGGVDGEFCIEFTEITLETCDDIAMANVSGVMDVCRDSVTSFTFDGMTNIPNVPVSGFTWVVSSADISGSMDPFNTNFLGNFGVVTTNATVYTPGLLNDGSQLPFGTYFFTPVVFAGASDTSGTGTLAGLDLLTDGCVITGTSTMVNLNDAIPAITATIDIVNETATELGSATVNATGGSGSDYVYLWSDGSTANPLTGVSAGDYSVTITDVTGCAGEYSETITIISTNTFDVVFDQSISLSPNPTIDRTQLFFNFAEQVDVQIQITNTLGQQLDFIERVGAKNDIVNINTTDFSAGLYFINISDGNRISTKRLIVQ